MAKNEIIPAPSLSITIAPEDKKPLVEPERLLAFMQEAMDDVRDDRKEIDEISQNFLDMVMNGGDASNSTKEALVNLLKIKSDTADKKIKIMGLLVQAFIKERETPKNVSAKQYNDFRTPGVKRQLLDDLEKETQNDS